MKSLKQLLSKVKSGRLDKKTAKDLDNLVTRGDGFVVITKSKKDGYNRFNANRVDDRGIEVVPDSRDFRPGKVRGMMRHKPEHLLGDINWKDVKDIYMENIMEKETKVGNYQTKYFHMCPGAKGLFTDIESKVDNMDIAERSAMLQDALFYIEKHILEDDETGSPEGYMLVANNLATNIMAMAKMMGLEKEHHYIQGHIDTIKKALSGEDTKSTADKLGESIDEARGTCWVGYKQVGMKDKGGKKVPNCVKEITEVFYEENGKGQGYTFEYIRTNDLNEAEYQGRDVKLGKIMQGDVKKFKVYVKNPKGNVVKVNFGQGGDAKGGTMRIRKSNPEARKSFRARHNCDNPGPRHKARYWSCRKW